MSYINYHPSTLAYTGPQTNYENPSPILHILAIFLLILAALGFASTLVVLPFGFLPSAPARSASPKSSSESRSIRVPSGVPNIKQGTWMTFILLVCLALVALQGPIQWVNNLPRRLAGHGYLQEVERDWWRDCVGVARAAGIDGAFLPLLIGGIALYILFDYAG